MVLNRQHTDSGDDNEGNGDAGDDFSCHGSVGLLYEIPQTDLVFDKLSTPEILFNLWEKFQNLVHQPKTCLTSFLILLASFFISSITCSFLVLYLF